MFRETHFDQFELMYL